MPERKTVSFQISDEHRSLATNDVLDGHLRLMKVCADRVLSNKVDAQRRGASISRDEMIFEAQLLECISTLSSFCQQNTNYNDGDIDGIVNSRAADVSKRFDRVATYFHQTVSGPSLEPKPILN